MLLEPFPYCTSRKLSYFGVRFSKQITSDEHTQALNEHEMLTLANTCQHYVMNELIAGA
jgi:hypothetical protein